MVRRFSSSGRAAWCLPLVLSLLAPPAVRAGWTSTSVPGIPNDVQIWAPGVFSVATDQGAFLVENGVITVSARVGEDIRGTLLAAESGCLGTVDHLGAKLAATCTSTTRTLPAGVVRMRHVARGGAGYVLRSLGGTGEVIYFPGGADPRAAAPSTAYGGLPPIWAMDVASVPLTGAVAVIAIEGGSTQDTRLLPLRGATVGATWNVDGTGATGDLDLVPSPAGLHYFLAAHNGLFRGASPDNGSTWTAATRVYAPSSGLTVRSVSLDGVGGLGGAFGHGVMVLGGSDQDRILRATPTFGPGSQSLPGERWSEPPTGLPGGAAPYALAQCLGAHTCVLTRPVSGGGNLAIYRNTSVPTALLAPAPTDVREGDVASLSFVTLSDADGDPLAVRWSATAAIGAPPVIVPSADGSRAEFDTAGLQVCEDARELTVRAEVSDGLASNQVTRQATMAIQRSRRPRVLPGVGLLDPGGTPLTLTADAADFGVCNPTAFQWRISGPATLGSPTGAQTTLIPAAAICDASGGMATVEVEAIAAAGTARSLPVTFSIAPWGDSPPPFEEGLVLRQPAGSSRTYRAAVHACEGSPGFPGQRTSWRLTSLPVDDVRFLGAGGVAVDPAGSDVPGSELTVVAGTCSAGVVELEASSARADGRGSSGLSRMTVEVFRPEVPLGDATLELAIDGVEQGVVRGRLNTNVPCPAEEGWQAEVTVLEGGVAVGPSVLLPVDRPFELPVPQACDGGDYMVRAILRDGTGAAGALAQAPFSTERSPARVGVLTEDGLEARCGDAALGALTLAPPADACLGATWTWTRLEGPPLEDEVLRGRSVELRTLAGLALASVVGKTLTFEVRAEAGEGNVDVQRVSVVIGSKPLVEVEARAETARVPEGGLSGAWVGLQNLTHCPLEGLELRSTLTGAIPSISSVRAQGERREARWDAGVAELRVPGVSLGAGGREDLEFLLQPNLVASTLALDADVWLNGVRVSRPASLANPPVAAGGCGCTGGGAAPMVTLALLWLHATRRRGLRDRR